MFVKFSVRFSRQLIRPAGLRREWFGRVRSQWLPLRSYASLSKKLFDSSSPPFPTWSYKEPCRVMTWSPTHQCKLSVASSDDVPANLLLLGVCAPTQDDCDVTVIEWNAKANILPPGVLDEILEMDADFKTGSEIGLSTSPVRCLSSSGKILRVALLGLGKTATMNCVATDGMQSSTGFKIGSGIAKVLAAETKIKKAVVVLPVDAVHYLRELVTSLYAGLYLDERYRSFDDKDKTRKKGKKVAEELTDVVLLMPPEVDGKIASSAIAEGKALARGVGLCRDIVNSPPNVLNPFTLAETATRIAQESRGTIRCKILDVDECEAMGMGAYLAVARGSEVGPKFIHLIYGDGGTNPKKRIAVVGKGLTFDTGGYDIKLKMMDLMKFDCGGSAATLGVAHALSSCEPPPDVEVHFIIAACENMINERAMRPGDILTASNGLTIEVLNTDAEGRLALADALVYADKVLKCEKIVELSTLTGACMIALGKNVAGLWTSSDSLAEALKDASDATGDLIWRMPLEASYHKLIEGKVSDLKNIGTTWGGAVQAALFLTNFVDKSKPFAHMDIAGPVWSDKEKAATGFGVRLVSEWIRKEIASKE